MEIIDAHAHIYPQKIAAKATEAIGDFYDITMEMPAGTPEKLIEIGASAGISGYLVHSVATKAGQVKSINDFIIEETRLHREFIGFMTLHQDLSEEEIFSEIERCKAAGLRGIKLHPDFQKFYIDGKEAEKFYRALSMINGVFPVLFHTGDNRYEFSRPERLAKVAAKYKKLYFIGAHFGGYRCWDDAWVYKGLDNVYFDTSSSLPFISSERAREIIDMLGYEKFFFGDDFPMWDAKKELERFFGLKLSEKQNSAILSGNLKNLLEL